MAQRLGNLMLLSALATSLTNICLGADKNGGYMMGGGIGAVSCIDFIASMEQARQLGWMRDKKSVDIVDPYIMFLSGYQTAYNANVSDTCDLFPATKGLELSNRLFQIENVCRQYPQLNFSSAVIRYADAVVEARLRICPQR